MLAPGTPENFVQLIDARDLSEWIIKMIENGETGIYNATSVSLDLTFGKMLEGMKTTLESDTRFVWADESFSLQTMSSRGAICLFICRNQMLRREIF
jgi:2'-hydroxyisoflavone reductase